MCGYLHHLRVVFPQGPLSIILDLYAVHRIPELIHTADEMDWELVFSPPGCTNLLQPLGQQVLGAVEALADSIGGLLITSTAMTR
jgi:hypothetical protein